MGCCVEEALRSDAVNPCTHISQATRHWLNDLTCRIGSHIQEEVAAASYNIHKLLYQRCRRSVLGRLSCSVISKREGVNAPC